MLDGKLRLLTNWLLYDHAIPPWNLGLTERVAQGQIVSRIDNENERATGTAPDLISVLMEAFVWHPVLKTDSD